MTVDHLASTLDAAADTLTTVDRSVAALAVPAAAFGADDAGAPGRIGRELYARWHAVLAARSREAVDAAAMLAGMAADVRTTARQYTETDDAVGRRLERELS
ncbi:hypothetical protein [Jidongwangia harbinensis]|uniref:hypothetical protein n=1 Tax=Jidongwangia harbinensis TaxID=2878561 RepID=UPI001CD96C59|nr:hypothetical protein [Jidongwangia harbinensis]MCA2214552.1 hypothetical protein [Jidongwangia harbinensis]